MARNKNLGYRTEKLVAEFLGMTRTGATGQQIYDLTDRNNNYYDLVKVEVKAGKQIPALFIKAFSQIENHLIGNQIGVVVMVPPNTGEKNLGENAVAVIKLKDFKQLLENIAIGSPKTITINYDSGVRHIVKGK